MQLVKSFNFLFNVIDEWSSMVVMVMSVMFVSFVFFVVILLCCRSFITIISGIGLRGRGGVFGQNVVITIVIGG